MPCAAKAIAVTIRLTTVPAASTTATTAKFARDRRLRSAKEAIAYMKKNKPAVVNVLKKYFKSTDDAAMGAAYDFYTNEVIPAQPFPRPELFGDAITALAARNDKVKGFDASKIVDQSFVQKAIDRGLDKG